MQYVVVQCAADIEFFQRARALLVLPTAVGDV